MAKVPTREKVETSELTTEAVLSIADNIDYPLFFAGTLLLAIGIYCFMQVYRKWSSEDRELRNRIVHKLIKDVDEEIPSISITQDGDTQKDKETEYLDNRKTILAKGKTQAGKTGKMFLNKETSKLFLKTIDRRQFHEELIIKFIFEEKASKKTLNPKSVSNSVFSIMLDEKRTNALLPRGGFFFSASIYAFLCSFNIIEINYLVVVTLSFFCSAHTLDYMLTKYRMEHGLFGTNGFEVKEIYHFVRSHSDKDDFFDSDGKRKKLSDNLPTNNNRKEIGAVDGVQGI